jgi:cobalt-zinc-cadmium efflux system outer membrane protein
MPRRKLVPIGTACLLVFCAPTVQAQIPLTFQQALTMARERAPRVAVARARIDEARGRLAGAAVRFRDNPVIDASAGPRWLETGNVTDYEFGLSQTFELGKRRDARIAGAEAGIARETAVSDATIRQLVRDVAMAYVQVLLAQKRVEVLEAAEIVARKALDVSERRFRAGDIALLDVNLARGSAARAASQTRGAQAARTTAVGDLKALLAWSDPADPQPVGTLNELIRAGLDVEIVAPIERPEVQSLVAEAAEARAEISLGKTLKKPDLGFGMRIKRDEGHQAAAGVVSIAIPLFNSGQEQIATGTARERRADLERTAVMSELDLRAQSARAAFTLRVSATEPLERDVLPGLEENERLAQRSFEVGELSLTDMLLIRREFVDTRLQYLEALAEAAAASIDWQMAAGVLR